MNHSSLLPSFGMPCYFNELRVSIILRASGVIMSTNKRFFEFTFSELSE